MLNSTLDIYLQAVLEAGPGATTVSYSLGTPDGSQSVQRRSMTDMVKAIADLRALIASFTQDASPSGGVHYSALRRVM